MTHRFRLFALALASPFPFRAAAGAQQIDFDATVADSCTMTVPANGTMAVSTEGTTLGTEEPGGSPASLVVNATGSNPTVTFGAPSLATSPVGWSATPSLGIAYTSSGGANQAYTDQETSHAVGALSDSFVVHGRIVASEGFASGDYVLRTVVTCSQG
ncbi:hypothetical protein [Sphingomicrobium astaxanthinifaciens]|uniref:hypothetical protein n=1 Tax=Sphingomicrobium astaxanthinifaciens TaxID=1227949 RepID=UPI001FCB26A9|nr:hypothetical protein [Sphingomicrobium astaxanthinifaciens]MCJ7421999.1 hypothetical protein [Sphingomicrobium astaxanthinifaciens]